MFLKLVCAIWSGLDNVAYDGDENKTKISPRGNFEVDIVGIVVYLFFTLYSIVA